MDRPILFDEPFEVAIQAGDKMYGGRVLAINESGTMVLVNFNNFFPALQWRHLQEIHNIPYNPTRHCG